LPVDSFTVLLDNTCSEQSAQLKIITELERHFVACFTLQRSVDDSEADRCLIISM